MFPWRPRASVSNPHPRNRWAGANSKQKSVTSADCDTKHSPWPADSEAVSQELQAVTGAGASLKYAVATHKGSEGPLEGSRDLRDLERPSEYEDIKSSSQKYVWAPRYTAPSLDCELTDKHSGRTRPRFAV